MKEENLNKKNVGRGALWSLLEGGLSQLLSLSVFLVTAHFVSPADFGLLATSMLLIDLSRNVLVEGVVTAVNRLPKPTDEDYNTCFFLIAGVSSVIALALFIFAEKIAHWIAIPNLATALQPISILLFFIGLSRTHEAYLSRGLHFRLLAMRSLVSIGIGGGVGIWMAVNGFGLWSLIAQQLITAMMSLLSLWTVTKWRPGLKLNRQSAANIMRYAKHVSVTGATNFANNQADIAFSAYYLGPAVTGQYNAAKRIGASINLVIANSLNRVAMPTFARMQEDRERAGRAFLQAVLFTSTITAPIFAGVSVLAPDIIRLVMGKEWSSVAPIMSIIAVSYFLATVGQYNQSVILVYGKPHWQTILTAIYAIANISLFFIFIDRGVYAIAWAFVGRAVAFYPVSIALALKLVGVRWKAYLGAFLPSIFSAAAMWVGLAVVRQEMVLFSEIRRLLMLVPLGALFYLFILFLINKNSIIELINFLKETIGNSKKL